MFKLDSLEAWAKVRVGDTIKSMYGHTSIVTQLGVIKDFTLSGRQMCGSFEFRCNTTGSLSCIPKGPQSFKQILTSKFT